MKILFLDIDGVVNCATTNFKTDLWPLDRHMAFLVGRIVLNTNAKVVLSSAWRIHPEATQVIEKHIVPIMDRTPKPWYDRDRDHYSTRGEEIQRWLDENKGSPFTREKLEITKYAILDDCSDMLPEQIPNFFRTSWASGLTEEIAIKVINHLNS